MMDEQRLAKIDSFWSQRLNRDHPIVNKACDDIPALVAEVRRLRESVLSMAGHVQPCSLCAGEADRGHPE